MSDVLNCHKLLLAGILLLGLSGHLGDAHRCYVCGPINNGFNKTCENFELNVSSYEEDCPEKYFSCSTQYEGADTVRQCERMKKVNDCKMANNVKYCYCSLNLCNGINGMVADTDDEDILGDAGSGFDLQPTSTDNNKNDINVIIQDVGGNSIETKTNKANTAEIRITISLVFVGLVLFC